MSQIDDEIKEMTTELKRCKALRERLHELRLRRKLENMSPNEREALRQLLMTNPDYPISDNQLSKEVL